MPTEAARNPADVLASRAGRNPVVILAEYRPTAQLAFQVGQVWAPRKIGSALIQRQDCWKIEAITSHPDSPVIARSHWGAIRCFGLNGHHDGEADPCDLDLVALMLEAV